LAKEGNPKRSRYTADRGLPGAYDGETVTRRRLFEGGALAVGGIASAAFGLPALGFALGPVFKEQEPKRWEDVGAETDFNDQFYVPKAITLVYQGQVGEAVKTTIYVRKTRKSDPRTLRDLPYAAVSNRCMHLGCPVRYVQASQRFICPCHGGVYGPNGEVVGGPPVRPLDRFYTRVVNGRVEIGARFSLNSHFQRFPHYRDPSQHLDGLWKYLYPGRFTT
jgi:Rieske Fe-S protein